MLRTLCSIHLPVVSRLTPLLILSSTRNLSAQQLRNYSRNIFGATEEEEVKKPITKKTQLPDDKPWDGDEPVDHSVLRMIMDKYRHPLRVEGAAKRNLPQPQSSYTPPAPPKEEKSSQKKKVERESKQREIKQTRIVHAKDAAFHYAFEKKYPTPTSSQGPTKKDIDWEDWETEKVPRSINDMGLLSDEVIRSARARGEFNDLPGRGKPMELDPLINNPFVDRTEYYMNRMMQRNGAAPPWVMMQQEVDTEISTLRLQMKTAFKRCLEEMQVQDHHISTPTLLKKFERVEKPYFDKELHKLNMRLRSYNVMCPAPVRKQLLDLDKEVTTAVKHYTAK